VQADVAALVERRSGAERGERRQALADRVVDLEREARPGDGDVDVEAEDELPARERSELALALSTNATSEQGLGDTTTLPRKDPKYFARTRR